MSDPTYSGTPRPQDISEPLGIDNNSARRLHFRGRSGCDEGRLHVDHDQRRLVGFEAVEKMQAAAAVKAAADDHLANLGSMHSAGKLRYLPGPWISWRAAGVSKN